MRPNSAERIQRHLAQREREQADALPPAPSPMVPGMQYSRVRQDGRVEYATLLTCVEGLGSHAREGELYRFGRKPITLTEDAEEWREWRLVGEADDSDSEPAPLDAA